MIHISKAHRMVGVPLREELVNLFPHARQVTYQGNPMIVLPHGLDETKLLRNLGIECPAPITQHYDWAGGNPYEVQIKTAAMLTTNERAYVLNGMGTGKTKAALWSFDYLRKQGLATRAIVVAPLSTLNFTWRREALQTVPGLSVGVLHGDRKRREKILAADHDIYVVNPDGLSVLFDQLSERVDLDCWIIDELAVFRNAQSKRTKILRKLLQGRRWAWGMTGSPTPNGPTDAYGQCLLLTPHTVPKWFSRFRDEVMLKVSNFKYVAKPNALEVVHRVMQPAVRFTLDDVVELPPVIERTVDIELGAKQKKIYDELRKHAYVLVQQNEITAVNAGAVLNKLLQVSMGYVYDKAKSVVPLDNDGRLEALVDAVNATDRKVLVFVPYTHALRGVADRLTREGYEVGVVDGSTPKTSRDEIFAQFQTTTRYKSIVAHPGTMAHGLTLTAADTVIWFGPTTSLEIFEQANARIRRIGQTSKQLILMFASTAAEQRIYARLRQKQSVQNDLLNMFADSTE